MILRTAAALRLNHLYHYQSFKPDYLRQVIVDGVIHFSQPSDFNDPWDCRPWFDFECLADPEMHEQHVQWYIDVTKKHRPEIPTNELEQRADAYRRDPAMLANKIREFSEAMAGAINAQYRVYCLSPKPDCELMWAHYAARHQGVCLEFAVRNELFCSALQVQYANSYPRFLMTGFSDLDQHLAPLLTKSATWGYEEEFRLISDEKDDPRQTIVTAGGKKAIPHMSLTAVILGCLAPASTKESIAQMVAESPHRPPIKAAVQMKNRYQLTIT